LSPPISRSFHALGAGTLNRPTKPGNLSIYAKDAERKLAAIITNIRRVDGPPNSRRCALMTEQFSSPWPPAHRIPLPHWTATVGPAAFHLSFSGNPVPTRARSLNDPARPFPNWMNPPAIADAMPVFRRMDRVISDFARADGAGRGDRDGARASGRQDKCQGRACFP
jgi:hypothetical protein